MSINIKNIGLTDYDDALTIQENTHQEIVDGAADSVICCEHPHVFTFGKTIEIVSVAKNVAQAKYAAQIVKDLKEKEQLKGATAVILGQESLLIPVVSGVAAVTEEWNVTMGYPLEQTTVAAFFNLWIEPN